MTYSFSIALANDVSKVRFHTGDNHTEGYFLDDETIQYFLTAGESVGQVSIRCIRYIITQLSQPNFRQDWLSVDNAEARKGYETLLRQKAQEFGISLTGASVGSTVTNPYRQDSYQTDGDYSETDD
jgi:hypothetical protein